MEVMTETPKTEYEMAQSFAYEYCEQEKYPTGFSGALAGFKAGFLHCWGECVIPKKRELTILKKEIADLKMKSRLIYSKRERLKFLETENATLKEQLKLAEKALDVGALACCYIESEDRDADPKEVLKVIYKVLNDVLAKLREMKSNGK